MSEWTIYFNPKCQTCRTTLEILKKKNIRPKVIEYLKNPPSIKTLNAILKATRLKPEEIIRSKEEVYSKLKLGEGTRSREDWLRAISENPVLLQRPIVIRDNYGVVARPPEKVEELFSKAPVL